MKEIRTEVEINATAGRIWHILTDFRSFPEWNPFIQRIEGEIKNGARLDVFLKLPEKKEMRFRPKVLNVEPEKEFRWIGHLVIPGIFDGEHILAIEPLGEHKINFVQKEKFTGILASLFLRSIKDATTQGFKAMNDALKIRAETTENALP
ncbi:MAG: SRPBCC domain-containing protein [Candidatus Aminicenantes bacterium]|nr:MAG: SRPBCC domain-containing protein [Candidatus Aminicenantes bacterium]